MMVKKELLCIGQVWHEDDDFIVLKIGKHDAVKFELKTDDDGETVGGDEFYSLFFARMDPDGATIWKPWEHEDE